MIEYNLYEYQEDKDKLKIYTEELQLFFKNNFGVIVESIDFDKNKNVILYIEHIKKINSKKIEKFLLNEIEHLNDVEVRNMKIILTFSSEFIELC